MNRSDAELVADHLSGNEKSLEVLIKRNLKPVYGFVYKYAGNAENSEDITQDVFVKMWKNLKRFDQNKNFRTWLFAIAKNSAIDFLKKKKAVPFSEFENKYGENVIAETFRDLSPIPSELSERKEKYRCLALVAAKLPQKYGEVLSLRYDKDLSFSEIARFLGEKLNTVKSRHRRAIMILKSVFLRQK
ncbi:hypothetical protein A3G55_02840 [Candidatus Giovannonibacteria bacterium RIFCSPLOWO2_12_FULL_44_25]|uniref:RNA polymerase, sigma-24 subunit, ECF subfamily n=4 Tax=Parcubacteria group TaxID=1794811 RepID=A0A837IKH9_9BACT|nr:MAG: RNA polymerase, sigma-24 subunit, ECF subfamily [Parcubacteria group bacterium GW2011_GWC1_44_10]KKT57088.1 MAG: RNA polymerase, sigma-24 subunit, ECF subfamily [Candidatus Giovannonibacteria bacterium GW2011_GWB1_44_23]KKT59525.1 MAG: RNA polymerase, sigma-24 subunit, ECF subfamily [Candidatus Giovannonibacteria bacterium GW2011_GWA1_44_25]KKU11900.1 MAG: RNA polymerase, sigma-24 subunit, ECF subfamily [Candidatus Azambacteria bacterium GW2011_GWC2_45_7b]OGF49972.1 MAG: hypothetical pr